MSGLFGAIGRGLSAAGYAAGDMYAKGALMDMEEERQKRLDEFRSEMALKNIPRETAARAEAELAAAPTKAKTDSLFATAKAEDELRLAPTKVKAKLATEYDPALVAAKAKEEEESARRKARVEREETAAAGSDRQYLAAVRRLAQAKHIEGLGSIRQAELAALEIGEKKKAIALFERFETATDPVEKAKIRESLVARGLIKSSESDTEKVTETEYDDMGNATKKVERTQKRGAGATPPPASKPKLAIGTEVDGYVFQGGNPKDQSNWVPKGRTSGGKVK